MRYVTWLVLSLGAGVAAAQYTASPTTTSKVLLLRTPDRGIQLQAVMDNGVLHLIYFKGDPGHGDVFYVQSKDEGKSFSKPLRINSHAGSVIAAGNVRGAHLAVGPGGRVHVAWMGSSMAEPKAPGGASPMLYTRLNDAGNAFEPERNVIKAAVGLDGGGSLAVHGKRVAVAWHAPTPGTKGEENRRVWLAMSADEGKTFDEESPISPAGAGACGCCGMRIVFSAAGEPLALFRGAREVVHRPMYLLAGDSGLGSLRAFKLQEWETGTCPMSTMAFATTPAETFFAWETEGQVSYARLGSGAKELSSPTAAPGSTKRRKHPALATNGREVLLAWTEGMGWNKGGSLAWQTYDAKDQPEMSRQTGAYGRADGVPMWSLLSAVALKDGRFMIIY